MGDNLPYKALILLPSDTDVSIQKTEAKLRAFFDKLSNYTRSVHIQSETQVREGKQEGWVDLTIDGWELFLGLSAASHNQTEAQEIANWLGAQCPVVLREKPYGVRFELSSDPDLNLDYFNEYIYVLETLASFEGAILFASLSGKLI